MNHFGIKSDRDHEGEGAVRRSSGINFSSSAPDSQLSDVFGFPRQTQHTSKQILCPQCACKKRNTHFSKGGRRATKGAVTTDHNGPLDFLGQPDRVFFGLSNHWFEAPLSKSGTDRLGVSRGQAPSRPRVQQDANPTRIQGEASTRLAERMMTCSSGTSHPTTNRCAFLGNGIDGAHPFNHLPKSTVRTIVQEAIVFVVDVELAGGRVQGRSSGHGDGALGVADGAQSRLIFDGAPVSLRRISASKPPPCTMNPEITRWNRVST